MKGAQGPGWEPWVQKGREPLTNPPQLHLSAPLCATHFITTLPQTAPIAPLTTHPQQMPTLRALTIFSNNTSCHMHTSFLSCTHLQVLLQMHTVSFTIPMNTSLTTFMASSPNTPISLCSSPPSPCSLVITARYPAVHTLSYCFWKQSVSTNYNSRVLAYLVRQHLCL